MEVMDGHWGRGQAMTRRDAEHSQLEEGVGMEVGWRFGFHLVARPQVTEGMLPNRISCRSSNDCVTFKTEREVNSSRLQLRHLAQVKIQKKKGYARSA
jgi:hypothetical protein